MRSLPTAHGNDYIKFVSLARMFALNGFQASVLNSYPILGVIHITHDAFYAARKVKLQLISE